MAYRFIIALCLLSKSLLAQVSLFDYQPMGLEPNLAGSFGELRNHHFHSGVDLRTKGIVGQPVRSVQEGYLKRLVVKPGGFGMALYISHPSGHTSVYAHLDRFQKPFHDLLLKHSLNSKSNLIDLYLKKDDYPVNAGDTIGWSGNSGSSSGPHLHFEWRDSRTQEPLNPVDFGLEIGSDIVNPNIIAVHTKMGQRVKSIWTDTLIIADWQDIGVEILEQQIPKGPKLGIKSMSAWIEDINEPNQQEDPDFSWEMKRFSFSATRGSDGHMQHNIHSKLGIRTYRIAPVSQPAKIWKNSYSYPENGIYELTIMIETMSGQKAVSKGPVIKNSSNSLWEIVSKTSSPIDWKSPSGEIEAGNLKISWSENSFMEPMKPQIIHTTFSKKSKWICSPDLPVTKSLNYLWTPPSDYPKTLRHKTVLIGKDPRGISKVVGRPTEGGRILFKMKLWGETYISSDISPPKIYFIGKKIFQNQEAFCFKLYDELLDIKNYRVKLNNSWQWAYYDAKNKNLLIPINPNIKIFNFEIFAEDEALNNTTFRHLIE